MGLNLSPTQVAFNARGDGKFNTPFPEQQAFFRQKLNLPTQHYDDIKTSGHDRAFVVAGATKAALLTDLHDAIQKAIDEGKSLDWFRKEFDTIVQRHGWEGWTGSETKAGHDWRTRVIYKTNLSASYAAGRYQQMKDPDVIKARPYWKYIHNDTVAHPRPLHKEWSGTVLAHDDPWWDTHYPPNGWGCRCRVTPVDKSEYSNQAAPENGEYTIQDRNGVNHTMPKGIDYGWGYEPGASLEPRNLSEQVMDEWRAVKADAWETLTPGNYVSNHRPAMIPIDQSSTSPAKRLFTADEATAALREQFHGDSKVYSVGGDCNYPVMIDAKTLGEHIDPVRAKYLPYIDDLMNDPYEVWSMIQRHKGTGKTEMRVRVIKRIDTGDKEGMLLVAQANKGQLEAWTFIPVDNLKYLNKQREGILIYGR